MEKLCRPHVSMSLILLYWQHMNDSQSNCILKAFSWIWLRFMKNGIYHENFQVTHARRIENSHYRTCCFLCLLIFFIYDCLPSSHNCTYLGLVIYYFLNNFFPVLSGICSLSLSIHETENAKNVFHCLFLCFYAKVYCCLMNSFSSRQPA